MFSVHLFEKAAFKGTEPQPNILNLHIVLAVEGRM